MNKSIVSIIEGMIIGVFMLIPGVSGGSIAMMLGIYDRLLDSVSNYFRNVKENSKFLASVAVGGLFGFVLMSQLISYLLVNARLQTVYFFIGIVVGGLWNSFISNSLIKYIRIFPLIFGVLSAYALKLLPQEILTLQGQMIAVRFFLFLLSGIVLAAALILPGISFSMMLVSLGLYNDFVDAITRFDYLFLIPFGLCIAFGVIVSSKILSAFLNKSPDACHSMIIGFALISIYDMFASIKETNGMAVGILLLLSGVFLSYFCCAFLNKKRA